jgi:hypothetical protein
MLARQSCEKPKFLNVREKIKPGSSIMILGRRHSGKSNLQWALLSHMAGWFDFGMGLTPTEESFIQLSKCMPSPLIREEDPDLVELIMEVMDSVNGTMRKEGRPLKKAFLVLDDTAYNETFMRHKSIQKLMFNGRHKEITVLWTMQYLKTVKPSTRNNADFIFVRYEGDAKIRTEIYQSWFSHIPRKQFNAMFDEMTKDYGCLVLDTRALVNSRDWRESIFWYRAPPIEKVPTFQLCNKNFQLLGKTCGIDVAMHKELPGEAARRATKFQKKEDVLSTRDCY